MFGDTYFTEESRFLFLSSYFENAIGEIDVFRIQVFVFTNR
jgi:hypothetical protein